MQLNLFRIVAVFGLLTLVAGGVVHVRSEIQRSAHRAQQAHLEAVAARKRVWELQMQLAEARSIQQLPTRVEELSLGVSPRGAAVERVLAEQPRSSGPRRRATQ